MLYQKSLLTFLNEDSLSSKDVSQDALKKSFDASHMKTGPVPPSKDDQLGSDVVKYALSKIMNELVLIKRANTGPEERLKAFNQALYYSNKWFKGWQDFLEYEEKVQLNKFSNSLKQGFDQPGEYIANSIWSAINRYRESVLKKSKTVTDDQANQRSEYEVKIDRYIDTQHDTPLYKKLVSKGMTPELEKQLGGNAQFYKDVLKRMDEKKKNSTLSASNREDASKRYEDRLNATNSMVNREAAAGKGQDVPPSDKEANAHGVPGQWRAEDNKVDPKEFPNVPTTVGAAAADKLQGNQNHENQNQQKSTSVAGDKPQVDQQTRVPGSTRVNDNYPASGVAAGTDSGSFADKVKKKFGDWANSPEAKKITDWSKKWMDRIVGVTKKVGLDSYGKVGAAAIGVIALFWLWRKFKKRNINESYDYLAEKFIHESDYLLDVMNLVEDQTFQQQSSAMEGSIKVILSKFISQAQSIVKTVQADKNMPDDMKQEFLNLANQLNGAALSKLNQQAPVRTVPNPNTSVKAPTQNQAQNVPQTAIKAPTQNPVPNTPQPQGKASRPK